MVETQRRYSVAAATTNSAEHRHLTGHQGVFARWLASFDLMAGRRCRTGMSGVFPIRLPENDFEYAHTVLLGAANLPGRGGAFPPRSYRFRLNSRNLLNSRRLWLLTGCCRQRGKICERRLRRIGRSLPAAARGLRIVHRLPRFDSSQLSAKVNFTKALPGSGTSIALSISRRSRDQERGTGRMDISAGCLGQWCRRLQATCGFEVCGPK